ncbi:MAG: hypothetical protein PVF14_19970 [Desulfobacterales bacterium]
MDYSPEAIAFIRILRRLPPPACSPYILPRPLSAAPQAMPGGLRHDRGGFSGGREESG